MDKRDILRDPVQHVDIKAFDSTPITAGSAGAGGRTKVHIEMVRHNMVDAIVATGATIVDRDFFEAPGLRHYKGRPVADDKKLRELCIDRMYDTYIDGEQLRACDNTVKESAGDLR